MKQTAIMLVALIMICLAGCSNNPAPTESTTETTAQIDAESFYAEACDKLRSSSDLVIEYSLSEQRTVGNDTYSKEVHGTDAYSGIGTDSMDCIVQQALTYGTYQTDYTELFTKATAYATINGSSFSSKMEEDAFLSRQIPCVLLDSDLYDSITVNADGSVYQLRFIGATAPEKWVLPSSNVQLLSANGTATLDLSGNILQYTYELAYIYGDVTYAFSIEAHLTATDHVDLSAIWPEVPQSPTAITDLDAPKLLLQAVCDVFSSESFSAEISQSLSCEVYSLTQTQKTSLQLHNTGDGLSAQMHSLLSSTDYRGSTVTTEQTDCYSNALLTSQTNNDPPLITTPMPTEIRTKWENTVLNSFFALTYLADAVINANDDILSIQFNGNDAFCDALSANLGEILPNDLDSIAETIQTVTASGFLRIDRATGLPVQTGMFFERTHMILGTNYPLTFSLLQDLTLSADPA